MFNFGLGDEFTIINFPYKLIRLKLVKSVHITHKSETHSQSLIISIIKEIPECGLIPHENPR